MSRVVYPNGDHYEGDTQNNLRHGWGRYTYTCRATDTTAPYFEGEWRHGHKTGYGTFFETEHKCLAGLWKADRLHGLGMFVSAADRYVGFFARGRRHGFGKLTTSNETLLGSWKQGRPQRSCLLINRRFGKVYVKEYHDGKQISKVNLDSVLSMTPLPPEASKELASHGGSLGGSLGGSNGGSHGGSQGGSNGGSQEGGSQTSSRQVAAHTRSLTASERRLSFHRSVNSRVRRLSGRLSRRLSQPAPRHTYKIASMCSGVASRGIATWTEEDIATLVQMLDLSDTLSATVKRHELDGEALLALLRLSASVPTRKGAVEVVCQELGIKSTSLGWYFVNCCKELVRLEYRRKERIGQLIPKASMSLVRTPVSSMLTDEGLNNVGSPSPNAGPADSNYCDPISELTFTNSVGSCDCPSCDDADAPPTRSESRTPLASETTLRHFLPDLGDFVVPLSDLEPISELGRGGFGCVELLRSKTMLVEVAGKELKREFLHVRTTEASYHHVRALREFVNELNLLRSLRHPNITMLWGVCLDPEKPLILTEYVPDGSLMDLLHKRRELLSRQSILSIARDVCAAMEYLHNESIIHCDLKSSNVLLQSFSTLHSERAKEDKVSLKQYHAKICDLGLARSLTHSTTLGGPIGIVENVLSMEDAAYEIGNEVGTPHWMAPEVFRGDPHTTMSDVYGFGLVLWEMLTNTIPFQHIKTSLVGAAVGFGRLRLPPVRTQLRDVDDIIQLLEACTKQDASARPSFASLHRDFRRLLSEEVTQKEKVETQPSASSMRQRSLFRFLKRATIDNSVREQSTSRSTLAESVT